MAIDCRKCKYYYVTWDPNNPHGCRQFGFKSKQIPSVVVFKSSGNPCIGFELKIKSK
ncbi:uracil-DNA glycosylase [Fusibacter ferrireducens]|uniref:Uracil-DNA glycosylase n=1 Tax=Fusibacter ferrireducens TaxID=2785058 RepID=A0ABR9ZRX9_9FIRM|nr:uracil-DNA glycosylase [Fusibacter ferrireducens]MBF4693224.1 uracil-DNA glycosylase [Fusibacter ferrireducens]